MHTELWRVARALLYARALDSLEAAPIAGTEGARVPFFSPDGQWVGFWAQGKLRRWPTAGGIPADIAEWPAVPLGAAWSSRGDIVLGTDGNGLHILRAGERAFSRLTTPDNSREASHVLPYFLPGGERLLFTVKPHPWGTRSHVEALALAGGERTVLIESGADARLLPTGHLAYMAEGTLMAVPFDPDRLKVTGQALPLVNGVAQALNALSSNANSGAAQWSYSAGGTLVYAAGSIHPDLETRVAWVDREGRSEPTVEPEPLVTSQHVLQPSE
ncbi:MAG: hypothetical protein R6V57_17985 [Vicinamibacterales bacterium]